CPDGWVGYHKVCHYLLKLEEEERSWEWSQEHCSVLGASVAVLRREWEMEFLLCLKGNVDYWVGLRR
ncbi:CD69 protein, partial [Halcyon senegalensis]|nr:CD69 protein [Halcyon senegalensis]